MSNIDKNGQHPSVLNYRLLIVVIVAILIARGTNAEDIERYVNVLLLLA